MTEHLSDAALVEMLERYKKATGQLTSILVSHGQFDLSNTEGSGG